MRVGFDPALVREWAREVERAGATAGWEAVAQLFRHLSEVSEGGALFQALLEAIESEELREDVMGLRKEWEDKARELGKREGREEGREEGRAQGRAELLLKLLRLKFGKIPRSAAQRVRRASLDELDRWAERVMTASTLEDVLG